LDPILDWKLTVSAPLQLINYLPIPCRFTLSGDEKVPGEDQQESSKLDSGVVNAGKSAFIFHVDLRKALYLYWVPQGSWQPKV
jgi:vacuolar protein sorting-associated protein 13A/C